MDNDVPVAAVTVELRSTLEERRNEIRARHERGAPGVVTCRALSDLADDVVRAAYGACRERVLGDGSARTGLALVALGGYGRSQLNPASDVDLLFLCADELTPEEQRLVEGTLPILWDAGLRVGHSCRSIGECLEVVGSDPETTTALLESRIITGNQLTYVRFRDALEGSLEGNLEWFVEAKLEERRERLADSGKSVLLLEPNVKESPGGLRDYHQVVWLSLALWGPIESAYPAGIRPLFSQERDVLGPAVDFLLRVRNGLHYMGGSAPDQVQFRMTDPLARSLGYGTAPDQKPEDAFMQDYYRHAARVRAVADSVERRARHALSRRAGKAKRPEALGDGFVAEGGELDREPCSEEEIRSNPGLIFEAFRLTARHGLLLHPRLREGLEGAVSVIDDGFRVSAEERDRFIALLAEPSPVGKSFEAMHDTGVLTAWLPELQGMHRLAIDDLYHRFTVDGHTLLCLSMLDALGSGDVDWGSPETEKLGEDFIQAVRGVRRLDLLRLGLLFHDAGKGFGSRHSERGAELIDAVAARWGMEAADRDLAHFLVEKHLLLTDVAFRRDPEDREVIRSLAEEVGDPERARTLLALTLADIMGVMPGLLSEWKIVLLWRLYRKLTAALEGRVQLVAERGEAREALIARLSERFGEETVRRHLDLMPQNYLVYATEEQIAAHLELLEAYDRQSAQVMIRPVDLAESPGAEGEAETSLEVHLSTQDRLGLFRDIVRACERENFEVNSARIFTRRDGTVVDTVAAVNRMPESAVDADRIELLRARLLRDLDPKRRLRRRMAPLEAPVIAPAARSAPSAERIRSRSQVKASSEISGAYTVIEFRHQDEPRLLAHVAEFLTDHDLDIQYARIYHEGRRIVGAFHVTGADGSKITDTGRLESIERELSEALEAHQAIQEPSGSESG